MSAFPELDRVVDEAHHDALAAFVTGDPGPLKRLFSHEADVIVAHPFGPPARGWQEAADAIDRAAALWRDGNVTGFERLGAYATPDLAYVVEIERYVARVGGSDEPASLALRVTTILRPEGGEWRIVHRHADAIRATSIQDSIIPW